MLGQLVAERVEPTGVRLRAASGTGAEHGSRAFLTLVEAELDGAYRLAAVILNDRADAEDAVHDAVEQAWRRWADLREREKASAWFGRIVVNRCRDRLRRRARRRLLELMRAPFPGEHPTVADASEEVGARDLLVRALDALSADEQIVVTLRYYADLTVPGIAECMGIAEGTVKSRLHHALRRMRAALQTAEQ